MKLGRIKWENVRLKVLPLPGSKCWLWMGTFNKTTPLYHTTSARRIVWYFARKREPPKRLVPACGNKRCVNPWHAMEAGELPPKSEWDAIRAASLLWPGEMDWLTEFMWEEGHEGGSDDEG